MRRTVNEGHPQKLYRWAWLLLAVPCLAFAHPGFPVWFIWLIVFGPAVIAGLLSVACGAALSPSGARWENAGNTLLGFVLMSVLYFAILFAALYAGARLPEGYFVTHVLLLLTCAVMPCVVTTRKSRKNTRA
jgi:phosphatidylglycerophosphate synthase